jgi:hypothetical protein
MCGFLGGRRIEEYTNTMNVIRLPAATSLPRLGPTTDNFEP